MKLADKIFETIISEIETEIAVTKQIITQTIDENEKGWTEDYKEGFIDGLKRVIELMTEDLD